MICAFVLIANVWINPCHIVSLQPQKGRTWRTHKKIVGCRVKLTGKNYEILPINCFKVMEQIKAKKKEPKS